ncbi:MAG: efflux RND transporter periplasmic adaptor subunit [Rhodocyclaceae bacterium]|nr:efflux RND transporter periplasmic adaptor subunit [Rhodocyclaceae bacterium]
MKSSLLLPFLCMGVLGLAGSPLARADAGPVPTLRVEARPLPLSYPAEAVVEARQQATLAAQVQGRIVELRVDAGSPVKRGEVLLRIDPAQAGQALAGAEAGVAQARANAANARAQFERTKSLVAKKFVSQSALDQAEAALKAADAQLIAAQAGRGQAATTLGFTTIASPLTGLVAKRYVEEGEMAQPGTPLVTVYDPATLRVGADIPQYRLPALQAGPLAARVEFPDGRWVDGGQVTLLPAADPRTHTLRVRVDLPPGLPGVAPGMAARLHLQGGVAVPRLAVPVSAVLRRGEVTGVYVADPQGRFALRQIRAGEPVGEGWVEVLSGLAGGETVAVDGVRAGMAARRTAAEK